MAQLRTRSRSPKVGNKLGLTLVELMVVLAIIATLSTIGFVRYRRVVSQAEEVVAVKELQDILDAIFLFEQANGHYPATLDDLGLGPLLDPWGNPYQYLNFSSDGGGGAQGGGAQGGGAQGGGAQGGGGGNGEKRKDRFLVPINTYFDLYSMGSDGKSVAPLTAAASADDIIVANDGDYIGLASQY